MPRPNAPPSSPNASRTFCRCRPPIISPQMPAIETRLAPAPAAPGKVFGGDAKGFPDHPAAGDDFDALMQATLAPGPQKFTGKTLAPIEKNLVAGKTSLTTSSITPVSAKKSETETSGEKIDGDKKTPPAAKGE